MKKDGAVLLRIHADPRQTRTDFLGDPFTAVVLGNAATAPQQIEDGQVRNGRAVGKAPTLQPGHSTRAELPTEFCEKPRFADARLTDNAYGLPVAVLDLLQKVVQDRQIVLAIDESRRAGRCRCALSGARLRDPEQAKGRDRISLAFEGEGSDWLDARIALRQLIGRIAQQDRRRLGRLLKPGGDIGGVAD